MYVYKNIPCRHCEDYKVVWRNYWLILPTSLLWTLEKEDFNRYILFNKQYFRSSSNNFGDLYVSRELCAMTYSKNEMTTAAEGSASTFNHRMKVVTSDREDHLKFQIHHRKSSSNHTDNLQTLQVLHILHDIRK